MAIYRIFSEKDAFIWSEQQTQNMGRDEILEISTYNNPEPTEGNLNKIPSATRALIYFPQWKIDNAIDRIISHSATAAASWSVDLHLYLANASNLSQNVSIDCHAVSQSWTMGTGRLADRPRTTNGVSWTYAQYSGSSSGLYWQTSSFIAGVTSSDNGIQRGGGNWWRTPSIGQVFSYTSDKDISLAVKPIVVLWHSHSRHGEVNYQNEGFIVKYTGSQEFNTSSIQQLSYFSMDTHTIYPPNLEFKWKDATFDSGSSPYVAPNSNFITTIGNLQSEIQDTSIYRFKIYTRDQFPPRSFQTASIYLNTKLLPTASYWAMKDVITGEYVVDFSEYTQLSSYPTYNYFEFFADGFEPERYYQILIRTTVGDETIVIDNPDYYFKIVR